MDSNDILLELLKQKCQEGHDMLSQYLRAFAIYVAIIGILVKFALDQGASAELRNTLLMAGIFISIVALYTCLLGHKIRISISSEIQNLNDKLNNPLLLTDLNHLKFTVIIALSFVVIVIIGL